MTRLLNIGSVIDPATRSVPLILEVQNDRGRLRIGLRGDLFVPTGEKSRGLAVPLSDVVDDKGDRNRVCADRRGDVRAP
jgi:cobalt-zinc-cadmium efflux system membrane fusion protein